MRSRRPPNTAEISVDRARRVRNCSNPLILAEQIPGYQGEAGLPETTGAHPQGQKRDPRCYMKDREGPRRQLHLIQPPAAPECFCNIVTLVSRRHGKKTHPGARASRPHNTWHSLGHLLDPGRPARAPCLCFGRAHAVPAGRAAGCPIARKPSGNPRDSMRAGRPRSRVGRPDGAVEGIRGATSLKADRRPLGNSRLPAGLAPSPFPGADQTRVKQQIFLAYREQGPCQVNSEFRIIEHGCTGCTGCTG